MPTLNKIMLIGNLCRDPELRYTPKGTAVCEINLAVNRVFTNDAGEKKDEATFVEVVFFGKSAELASKHLSKGNPLFVEGRLQQDNWEDKATGQKRSKLRIVSENFQFLHSSPERASHSKNTPAAEREW